MFEGFGELRNGAFEPELTEQLGHVTNDVPSIVAQQVDCCLASLRCVSQRIEEGTPLHHARSIDEVSEERCRSVGAGTNEDLAYVGAVEGVNEEGRQPFECIGAYGPSDSDTVRAPTPLIRGFTLAVDQLLESGDGHLDLSTGQRVFEMYRHRADAPEDISFVRGGEELFESSTQWCVG